MSGSPPANPSGPSDGKFGTFAGVFTPSILTILGVIMYLRFGWVVGQAGLAGTLLIVLIAHTITVSTGLSISAIATNQTVKTGGAYFMISRSLGLELGGAIGIPLFFGQALSVSLYVMGFTESFGPVLQQVMPGVPPQAVSTVVCVILAGLSMWSADIAIKTQYFVMVAILLSLISFILGTGGAGSGSIDLWPKTVNGQAAVGFAAVFAVFFPAVTGITAGISMSGDLRDPRRAIPRGTMAAIFVGMAIYMTIPVFLALKADTATLRADMLIMQHVAWLPALILAGVWGATLSSAIGSILGAPRTLQALALDGVAPRVLARGSGPNDEPRAGILVTLVIAVAGIWLGDLNMIAPILTMFFLVTYGMINLACGLERWADSPAFRPEFKVPVWVSFFGAAASFYMMSFISLPAAAISAVLVVGIYALLQRKSMETTWGDARHGLWAALVRMGLLRLKQAAWHPRNWRPNAIVLGGSPTARPHLIEVGLWLGGEKGLVTYFYLIAGQVRDLQERRSVLQKTTAERLSRTYPNLLTRVEVCSNIYEGVRAVAQSYGLAGFESNTVVMGWGHQEERAHDYGNLIYDLTLLDKCLVLVAFDEVREFGRHSRVDIWWGGLDNNGGLMLLLAHLLLAHREWALAEVRVKMIVPTAQRAARTEKMLQRIIDESRIRATPEVIVNPQDGRSIGDIISQNSVRSDLVIMGLRPPEPDQGDVFVQRVNALIEKLPTVLLVRASEEFAGAQMIFEDDHNPTMPAEKPPGSAGQDED
ncbi:MAG: Na-K-Cl cotransporter [bacterium]